jgi:hypothetical protein
MQLRFIPALLWVGAASAALAAPNQVANPELESDLSGWMGQGGSISQVALDAFGRADSGSAQLTASLGGSVTLYQCVAVAANIDVDFGAWVEIPSFQEATGSAVVKLEWWSEPGCAGSQIDVPAETATISAVGTWSYAALRNVTPPEGAHSAKLRAMNLPDAADFIVHFDSLFAAPAGALFVPAVGEIVVADGSKKIVKVEPETGAQRLISSGAYFARPTGVAIDGAGTLWVVSPVGTPLVTVDPATGLQDAPMTTGATPSSPWDIDIAYDGSFWIAGNGLWELAMPGANVVLRKALANTAYGLFVDTNFATGETSIVTLALGGAGLADFDSGSGDLTPVAGTPTVSGRYDYGVWMPNDSSTRVFTEVEPIAPSSCNGAASGVQAVDGDPPIVGGNFRCPRGLATGGPDDPGYVSDGSAFTGSQEGQIIAIDRAGTQTLVTRSGFLVDPWDVEVVPEPGGVLGAIAAAGALALARAFSRA